MPEKKALFLQKNGIGKILFAQMPHAFKSWKRASALQMISLKTLIFVVLLQKSPCSNLQL